MLQLGAVERYGELLETRGPVATLRVDRQTVASSLAEILDIHQLEDITVDEVPLEEVIAEVFRTDRTDETSARTTPVVVV